MSSVDAIFNNTGPDEQNFYFFTFAADPMHQGDYVAERDVWVSGRATDEKRSNLFESANVGFNEVNVESPAGYEGTITVELIGHCLEP